MDSPFLHLPALFISILSVPLPFSLLVRCVALLGRCRPRIPGPAAVVVRVYLGLLLLSSAYTWACCCCRPRIPGPAAVVVRVYLGLLLLSSAYTWACCCCRPRIPGPAVVGACIRARVPACVCVCVRYLVRGVRDDLLGHVQAGG